MLKLKKKNILNEKNKCIMNLMVEIEVYNKMIDFTYIN
jgi:hypothetical protein